MIVTPSSSDWLDTADFDAGTVLVEGRLAEMLRPELWQGCVGAWAHGLDPHPWDYSGSGNPAARINAVADTPDAWKLAAASTSFLSVADRDNLNLSTTFLFSFAAWVAFDASAATYAIMGKGDNQVTNLISFIWNSAISALRVTINDTVNTTTYDGSTNVAADPRWRHAAFVVANRQATPGADDIEIYVDGAPEATLNLSAAGTNTNLTTTNPLQIGSRELSSVTSDVLEGRIAGAIHHRRALSAKEIQLLAERPGTEYECRLQPRRFFFP